MFRIILFTSFILGAWKWGDWKNWRKYYSTILYFILMGHTYNILFYNFRLWEFQPLFPIQGVLPNHVLIFLANALIVYPATTLMYLGNYPKGKMQYFYIIFCAFLFTLIEMIGLSVNAIVHYKWSIEWSFMFNVLTFSYLRLHYLYPVITWLLSIITIIIFAIYFGLPIESIK